jgi:hypothetical protein
VLAGNSHLQLAMPYWSMLWSRSPDSAPGNASRTSALLTTAQGSSGDAAVAADAEVASVTGASAFEQAARLDAHRMAASTAGRSESFMGISGKVGKGVTDSYGFPASSGQMSK